MIPRFPHRAPVPPAAICALALACGAPAPPKATPVRTADDLARAYVRLAFSLRQQDPLFLDLVFSDGAPSGPAPPLPEIAARADRLAGNAREMARTEDEFRVRRIEASLRALAFRTRSLLGERRPVIEELREIFGLTWAEPAPDRDRLHFRIARALPGVGPLRVRVRRHYERSDVPPEAAESHLLAALAACRELVHPEAAAPRIEPLRLRWMDPAEAAALPTGPAPFYRYQGAGRGALLLPRGLAFRLPELDRLACHEGVPGHHLQAAVAEAQFRATGWPELGIVPLYGPRTAVFEGLAATLERLVRSTPADEALRALEPVVSSVLARYLDGELNRIEALRALDFEALVPDPHGLLAHADRFGGYALVRPSADPMFRAALETFLDPELSPADLLGRVLRAIREAMSPEELASVVSSP